MANSNLKVTITAVDKATKTLDKVGDGFSTVGKIASVVSVAALAGFSKAAIDAASDLEETQSKVGVIFGDSADKIEKFADTSAEALGQSKTEAMSAAATFATFGKAAGLTGDDLASFSTQFTTLASDLASFNNTSPEQAIEAIGAALRGESEPIRAYGVMLDDATLKQEALKLGIIKTTRDALTPQQKTLAAQAAIMKQTTDAQGDFARTSDGLANQQRILAAEFKDAQAQLGQFLLPYAKQAVSVFKDLLGKFTDLAPETQKTVVQVTALGGAAAFVVPKMGSLFGSISDGIRTMTIAQARTVTLTAAIAAIGTIAIAASNDASELTADIDAMLDTFARAGGAENLRGLKRELAELRQQAKDMGAQESFWSQGLSDGFKQWAYRLSHGFRDIGVDIDNYDQKIKDTLGHQGAIFRDVAHEMGLTTQEAKDLAEASGVDLTQGATDAADAIMDYYNSNVKSKSATERAADAQSTLNDEFATGEDKIKAYRAQLDLLDGGSLDVDESRDRAKDSIQRFTESLKENGNTFSSNSEKGRANKAALRDVAEAGRDAAEAVFKNTVANKGTVEATRLANDELVAQRDRFLKAAEAAGITKDEAWKLAKQYGLVPKKVETKAVFNKEQAAADVGDFKAWLWKQDIDMPVKLNLTPAQQQLLAGTTPGSPAAARIGGARASGGPVRAGEMYLVGEKRPELFVPSQNGTIIPRVPTAGGGSALGGTTVVVNVQGHALASKADIARVVVDAVKSAGGRGLAVS